MPTTDPLLSFPAHRPLRLRNANCPYCGVAFQYDAEWDREHVVGRNFVPRGTLHQHWNLIVRACRSCNAAKAELEDDISAITMQPNSAGEFACDDLRLVQEAERKARNSISRRTRRPVKASREELQLKSSFGGAQFTFNFVAPPQVDDERLFELARLQLQGFFFFISYDEATHRGGFWLGGFHPVLAVRKENWGDLRMHWFEETTRTWDPKWFAATADGFHRSWIKRPEDDRPFWAWALEWNRNYRIIGFFGEREHADALRPTMPRPQLEQVSRTEQGWIGYRRDVPLTEVEDRLFVEPVGAREPA
jgi:hypothetical protein